MELTNNSSCRRCDTEEETSVHILCECEALASLRHKDLGSLSLGPEDINPLNAELNPICHLLALLEALHIFNVSGLRVKESKYGGHLELSKRTGLP